MPRELGEKSQAILVALHESGTTLTADDVALVIGDTEDGGVPRVRALLKSLAGKGLVHQPRRNEWADGPASAEPETALLAAEPATTPTRSKRLAEAGYTPRDTRLTCDECGRKFTRQMLPIHKCAAVPRPVDLDGPPVNDSRSSEASARLRFDLIASIVKAARVEVAVEATAPNGGTIITLRLFTEAA